MFGAVWLEKELFYFHYLRKNGVASLQLPDVHANDVATDGTLWEQPPTPRYVCWMNETTWFSTRAVSAVTPIYFRPETLSDSRNSLVEGGGGVWLFGLAVLCLGKRTRVSGFGFECSVSKEIAVGYCLSILLVDIIQ